MAELKKVEEVQYDVPLLDDPFGIPEEKSKKVQQKIELPQSPKKRLRNISFIEKAIGFILLVSIIGIALLTIQVRTSIIKATNTITQTQTQIEEKNEMSLKLEQQKNELSKADRVKEIAKNKGLSVNEGNLRKVK